MMNSVTNINHERSLETKKSCCSDNNWISNLFVHPSSSSCTLEEKGRKTRRVLFGLYVLYSLSIGSTVGVVPSLMMTRYAQQNHGLPMDQHCGGTSSTLCNLGSANAQTAAATASFINNGLTFFTSSLIGSLSDVYGRKRKSTKQN